MSALTDYQNGSTFPPIATTLLSKIADGLNPKDTAQIGGPPALPAVMSAVIDAVVSLDQAVNG